MLLPESRNDVGRFRDCDGCRWSSITRVTLAINPVNVSEGAFDVHTELVKPNQHAVFDETENDWPTSDSKC